MHELGWICMLLYSRQTGSISNFLLVFLGYFSTSVMFLIFCSWWLMDGIVDAPLRRVKIIFSIYHGTLRSQAYEGYRSTVLEMSIE